ncbi:uncharacterized protein BKCO1_980005 [Diplodia corticola]|uniref:Uncharacterized protein n=1 Tax=Diplodia corticola TaxID=236234 RepID=A0A1J9QKJ4_9PEZI|nr:uncharacterized protein BKCO1_980005 [Diplodia corticola]OJD29000.1 hypothetical protein BKCO1_980005 [Diplodia corticola]
MRRRAASAPLTSQKRTDTTFYLSVGIRQSHCADIPLGVHHLWAEDYSYSTALNNVAIISLRLGAHHQETIERLHVHYAGSPPYKAGLRVLPSSLARERAAVLPVLPFTVDNPCWAEPVLETMSHQHTAKLAQGCSNISDEDPENIVETVKVATCEQLSSVGSLTLFGGNLPQDASASQANGHCKCARNEAISDCLILRIDASQLPFHPLKPAKIIQRTPTSSQHASPSLLTTSPPRSIAGHSNSGSNTILSDGMDDVLRLLITKVSLCCPQPASSTPLLRPDASKNDNQQNIEIGPKNHHEVLDTKQMMLPRYNWVQDMCYHAQMAREQQKVEMNHEQWLMTLNLTVPQVEQFFYPAQPSSQTYSVLFERRDNGASTGLRA